MDLLIYGFDLFGTFVFAVTGALRGIHHRLDFLGVTVLSCAVGVGGGMIRDVLIGATPVAAFQNSTYLIVCAATGAITFFLSPVVKDKWNLIPIFDAIGLGVFTAIGAEKGFQYGIPRVGIVLCGVLTSIGGGVIRDIMVIRVPAVLKSDFYATASLIGGLFYLLIRPVEMPFAARFLSVAACVTLIRLLAIRFKLRLPSARGRRYIEKE